jgi:5,10-methylenetetrahydromethanopterin reductase
MSTSGAPLRFGISISNEVPVPDSVALARRAEELGLAEVWLPESGHGRGIFTVAAQIAAATSRLSLGIGIVNPFWRHPSVIAMEAATLDEVSGGRVRLGIGAALWTLRALGEDDWRTRRPLAAMAEALSIVRAELSATPSINPEIYRARSDAHLDFATVRPHIPLYVGAVNEKMLELSGALADGVELGAIASPAYVKWAWERIMAGALAAGREPADLDLVSLVLVSVDRDGRRARDAVREVLAYYLSRVEGVVVDRSGADPEQVRAVRERVAGAGPAAGAAAVTDGLIDTFAAAGTPDQVAAKLQHFVDAGARGVLAWHVFGPDKAEGLRLFAERVVPVLQTDGRLAEPIAARECGHPVKGYT